MDEATQTQDVNQIDQTMTTPSDGQQSTEAMTQPVDQNTGEVSQVSNVSAEDVKTVPYDRFSEVNTKAQTYQSENLQLKAKLEAYEKSLSTFQNPQVQAQQQSLDPAMQQRTAIKQALAPFIKELAPELGLVSKEEIAREKQDQRLEGELQALETEFNGKADPNLKFNRAEVIDYAIKNGIGNPRAAFTVMKQDAILNYKIQQAVAKTQGIKTEGSNGSGSQNVGTSNDDLKAAAAKGDATARRLLLKRIAQGVGQK